MRVCVLVLPLCLATNLRWGGMRSARSRSTRRSRKRKLVDIEIRLQILFAADGDSLEIFVALYNNCEQLGSLCI